MVLVTRGTATGDWYEKKESTNQAAEVGAEMRWEYWIRVLLEDKGITT